MSANPLQLAALIVGVLVAAAIARNLRPLERMRAVWFWISRPATPPPPNHAALARHERHHWSITEEGLWVAQAKPLLDQLTALMDRPGQLYYLVCPRLADFISVNKHHRGTQNAIATQTYLRSHRVGLALIDPCTGAALGVLLVASWDNGMAKSALAARAIPFVDVNPSDQHAVAKALVELKIELKPRVRAPAPTSSRAPRASAAGKTQPPTEKPAPSTNRAAPRASKPAAPLSQVEAATPAPPASAEPVPVATATTAPPPGPAESATENTKPDLSTLMGQISGPGRI